MGKYDELFPLLAGLKDYITKDMAGMALNVDPVSYKGEGPSKDTPLPADWVKKLDPLSGGKGGEKEVPPAAKSKVAVSGTDPYLHKEGEMVEDKAHMDEGAKEMLEDETGDVVDDGMEVKDEEEDEDILKSAEVVGLLRDIKGLLEQSYVSKQTLAEVSAMKDAFAGLQKSMPTMMEKEVKKGLKTSLRSFGMMAASNSGDVVKRNTPVPSIPIKIAEKIDVLADKRIGLEGEAFEKSLDPVSSHNQWVDGVESVLDTTDTMDLKGCFRRLNTMREQSGQSFTNHQWYFKTR